jgi:hypothetical protein
LGADERDHADQGAEWAVDESAGGEGNAAADAVEDVEAEAAAGDMPVGEEVSVDDSRAAAGTEGEEGVAQPGG